MPYKISKIKWSKDDQKFKVTITTGAGDCNIQHVLSPVRVALENYVREFIADRQANAKIYDREHDR